MLKYSYTIPVLLFFLLSGPLSAQELDSRPSDWHVGGSVVFSSRSLDGTIFSRTAGSGGRFGDLVTTADAMGVDDSNGAMLALGVQYKRFGLGINYLPTSFEGSGSALVAGTGANAGVFIQTPLETDIDVDMLLASAYYNLIQEPNTVFGVGFGLGGTIIDLSIVPEVGTVLAYEGSQPFAFLNLHFMNRHRRFLYGFSLNGLSMDVDGVNVVYSDYKADLGYRLHDARAKVDLVGGYRLVNFAIDLDGTGGKIAADVSLEGPFLGVKATY
jgi:hypothetical protein